MLGPLAAPDLGKAACRLPGWVRRREPPLGKFSLAAAGCLKQLKRVVIQISVKHIVSVMQ